MSGWTHDELKLIAEGDDFYVAPFREDSRTPGTSVWVWAVIVDDVAYVRTSNPASRWFAAAIRQRAGNATVHGHTRSVVFHHVVDDLLLHRIDRAFTKKYTNDPYFSPTVLLDSRTRVAGLMPTEELLCDDQSSQ